MRTYSVRVGRVNITLSADEKLVAAARAAARRKGTSLNELVREYMARLAGEKPPAQAASDLVKLLRKSGGDSGGRRVRRDDLYEGRA